ncbi:TPA: Transcription initiation factor TFIID subunit 13 [Trebouxia sp. C0005]
MNTAKVAKGKRKKAGTPAPDEAVTEKVLDTKGLLAKDCEFLHPVLCFLPMLRAYQVPAAVTAAVANMMYGFGDDCTPYKESVDLVEDMVINYVVDTWQKTLASAHSRSTKVSEKDVIFLLRKDKKKYERARELLYLEDQFAVAKRVDNGIPDIRDVKGML